MKFKDPFFLSNIDHIKSLGLNPAIQDYANHMKLFEGSAVKQIAKDMEYHRNLLQGTAVGQAAREMEKYGKLFQSSAVEQFTSAMKERENILKSPVMEYLKQFENRYSMGVISQIGEAAKLFANNLSVINNITSSLNTIRGIPEQLNGFLNNTNNAWEILNKRYDDFQYEIAVIRHKNLDSEIDYETENDKEVLQTDLLNRPLLKFVYFPIILYSAIANDPEKMLKLEPYEFEEFTAEIFNKYGFDIQLTPRTRDGGKDIIIKKYDANGVPKRFAVECKKYNQNNPVGISIVQRLFGVVSGEDFDNGYIVTTSRFTHDAINWNLTTETPLLLKDYRDVCLMLKNSLHNSDSKN